MLWTLLACASGLATAGATMSLPDGRVWEMVSPLDKNGGNVVGIEGWGGGGVVQAAAKGDAITYLSQASFGGHEHEPLGAPANQYLSERSAEGWSTQNITTPANAQTYGEAGTGAPYKAFSSELSLGLLLNGEQEGIENPPLSSEPEAPAGYQNFYLRAMGNDSLTPLLTAAPTMPANEAYMFFQGASADLKHIVVSSDAALTQGAVVEGRHSNLYEWTQGEFQAVNVLPEDNSDGKTTPEAVLGSGLGESNTIAGNGSRVFWGFGGNRSPLYVRKEGRETTRIDVSYGGPITGENENSFSRFKTASVDGEKAFFTSHLPLTSDANTGLPCECKRPGNDLYRFNVQSSELTDLSADPLAENGAEVQGVLGASGDGSYVYFVAKGVLSGVNRENRSPVSGGDNLYVWHEDPSTHVKTTIFVASLSSEDEQASSENGISIAHDWSSEVIKRTARVTPDGKHVVFMSNTSLTGYDNIDATTESLDEEVYLYSTESEQLSCASCNPLHPRAEGSSGIPGGTPYEHLESGGAIYQSRVLADDGSRVFFDSDDALVPQDTNGEEDVYEYESGRRYLISSGTGNSGSVFVDASESGNDVFFLTDQQLGRQDTDQLVDLYDARVGGGFVESSPSSPCVAEGCRQPISSAPAFGLPGSVMFAGSGNEPGAPKQIIKSKPKHKVKHKKSPKKPRGKARHVHTGKRVKKASTTGAERRLPVHN